MEMSCKKHENPISQWILALVTAALCLWSSPSLALSKQESLSQLQQLKKQNFDRLRQLDERIRSNLTTIHRLKIQSQPGKPIDSAQFVNLENEMKSLRNQRKEHLLRQDFLDRLSFQVQQKYKGRQLKEFLQNILLEMSLTEASSLKGSETMWKFLSYLGVAIKDLPERNENILSFIEGYMNFSSIANPVRPSEYISLRNYSNGYASERGNPVSKEDVGDIVESRLKKIEAEKVLHQLKLDFKERRPVLKPAQQMTASTNPEDPALQKSSVDSMPQLESPSQRQNDEHLFKLRYKLDESFTYEPQEGPAPQQSKSEFIEPSERPAETPTVANPAEHADDKKDSNEEVNDLKIRLLPKSETPSKVN